MKNSFVFTLSLFAAALAHDARPLKMERRQLLPAPVKPLAQFLKSEIVPMEPVKPAVATPANLAAAPSSSSSSSAPAASSPSSPAPAPEGDKGEAPPPPAAGGNLDATILAFAATLEDFESQLYAAGQGFSVEDWKKAGFNDHQIKVVQETIQTVLVDEQSHLGFLSEALAGAGAPFSPKCSFDFSSVTDPITFLATAAAVETVGIGAYQGAGPLVSAAIIPPALSIHAIEARHAAALAILNGQTFAPNAFDMPLAAQEVLAIAQGFFVGCTPEDLGLTSNEPLVCTVKDDGGAVFKSGSSLDFSANVDLPDTLFCQILVAGEKEPRISPKTDCKIPEGLEGQAWVFLTTDETPLSVADSVSRAAATNLCAGPAQILISNEESAFLRLFGLGVQYEHVNGAQCAINQMKGYKEEGKLKVGEYEVYNLLHQKEVKMIIKHEDGKEEKKNYELGYKGQYSPPAYYYDYNNYAPPAHAPPAEYTPQHEPEYKPEQNYGGEYKPEQQYHAEYKPAEYSPAPAPAQHEAPPAQAYYRRSTHRRQRRSAH